MRPQLKEFLQRWAITTVAVLIAEWLVPGIRSSAWPGLLVATLVLGTANAVLRPILVAGTVGVLAGLNLLIGVRMALLTLPLQVVLFGFLLLVINAALLLGVAALIPTFQVAGFWTAFWGGVIISLSSLVLNSLTGSGNARVSVFRGPPRPPGSPGDRRNGRNNDDDDDTKGGGSGPIIDV
jgi:putative membrane protein